MKIILIILGVLAFLILIGWMGLQVKPTSFPVFSQKSAELATIPLPAGLPAPVERFYRKVYGENIPVIETVVMSGHATMRPFGNVTLPGRFRFTHDAGRGYRHYIEATWFNLPIIQVNERYLDGKALGELPFGIRSEGNQVDQAANLGMWAELSWVPAIFLTDPRVRWDGVDDATAILVVPFEDTEERYVVRFDPANDLLHLTEIMRYKDQSSQGKSLWINESLEYASLNGIPTSVRGAATWHEDGRPWAVFSLEEIILNVDVSQSIRAKGLN